MNTRKQPNHRMGIYPHKGLVNDDNARKGLNLLLRAYPDADVALVQHQRYQESTGPWTCVDLIVNRERQQFAIWNSTGNVYRVQRVGDEYPGAVEDDPFLEPVTEQAVRKADERLCRALDEI